jgi:hypothetical protein
MYPDKGITKAALARLPETDVAGVMNDDKIGRDWLTKCGAEETRRITAMIEEHKVRLELEETEKNGLMPMSG